MDLIVEEFERGRQESAADIAAGSPKLIWQTVGAWGEFRNRLMAERFGVAVQTVSDITSCSEKFFHDGYNSATAAYVDEAFGEGSFQEALDEVDRFRNLRYQRYLESKENAENT